MGHLDDLRQSAKDSYMWLSHDPNGRGSRLIDEYERILQSDLQHIPEHWKERYIQKFKMQLSGWIGSNSRCASSFITGSAGFPAEQQRKRHDAQQKRYETFEEWRNKVTTAFIRQAKKANRGNEVEENMKKLQVLKDYHEKMKICNSIIKKHKGNDTAIPEIKEKTNFPDKLISQIMNPPHYQSKGFATYELTNNLAKIKHTQARIDELQKKEQIKESNPKQSQTINGITITQDFEDDRTKIFFDGKPAPDVIAACKRHAFKWSPYLKCWCRKLTNAALYDAQEIAKAVTN